jgi:hypothetical protein
VELLELSCGSEPTICVSVSAAVAEADVGLAEGELLNTDWDCLDNGGLNLGYLIIFVVECGC